MKPERFKRTKSVVASSAIALVVAALVFGLTSVVLPTKQLPKMALTAGTDFAITSTVTAWPSCPASPPAPTSLLGPGVTNCLTYIVSNPLSVPITVTSMSITGVAAPASCPASNLDLSQSTFSGALVVPEKVGSVDGTNHTSVKIAFADDPHNPQQSCINKTFTFTYAGTAQYTEVYATSTQVTSNLYPTSQTGQTVTYAATITATKAAGQDDIPSGPTGTVSFMDGTSTISGCAAQPVTPGATTGATATGTATCMVTYSSVAGSPHHITGVYTNPAGNTNTDGNFSGSTSPGTNQIVLSSACITTAKSGNLTITSGQAICIATGGSQSGNVTVNSGGELDILGGSVGGSVTVNSGGALYINTGKVSGNVSATGASYFTVCGGTFSGNISDSSSPSTTFVLIGDNGDDGSPGCAGNTVAGNISVSSNAAGAEIGGNTVSGGITLSGTTGTPSGADKANPEIENNKVNGGLACSGNSPVPINDNQPNTVKGSRTGQCSAAGF